MAISLAPALETDNINEDPKLSLPSIFFIESESVTRFAQAHDVANHRPSVFALLGAGVIFIDKVTDPPPILKS